MEKRIDPNVKRRMELVRRSFTGRKWRNKEDKREYERLVNESMVILGKYHAAR